MIPGTIRKTPGDGAPRRRVLMVAFHFPPEGGSGTQRTLKFARYLPEFGWDVDILSVRTAAYDLLDPSLTKEVPEQVQVHRTYCLNLVRTLNIRGRYPGVLEIPDRYASWFLFGLAAGMRLIRSRRIDVLYSTSPIPTAHLIARVLARWSGLPWVCDFRDPWWYGTGPPDLRTRVLRRLERGVVTAATHVLANTDLMYRDVRSRYADLSAEKFSVLPNGYDEADFENISPARPEGGPLRLVHTGEIYLELRDPRPLLLAAKTLIDRGFANRDELRVRFVGAGAALTSDEFQNWIRENGVGDLVEIDDHVSHRECIAEQLGAGVLLLLQCAPKSNRQIPAKAYEYLRAGRPVLSVVPPESATAGLMRSTNAGWIVDASDAAGLCRTLEEALTQHRNQRLATAPARATPFERRRLARQLSEILGQHLRGRRATPETSEKN